MSDPDALASLRLQLNSALATSDSLRLRLAEAQATMRMAYDAMRFARDYWGDGYQPNTLWVNAWDALRAALAPAAEKPPPQEPCGKCEHWSKSVGTCLFYLITVGAEECFPCDRRLKGISPKPSPPPAKGASDE